MAKTLTVYLAADLSRLNRGLKDGQAQMQGFGGQLKNVLGPAMIAVGAAAGAMAIKIGVDAVSAASDLSETISKSNVVFGDAATAVQQFSENANISLGQTQQQALDAATTFGVFGKAAGLTGGDLANFSTQLVTLSADLASFSNTTPEDAIQALGAALRGESEPIRRYGVLLDDATLKAKALEMGIYDGTGALSVQTRTLAAYQVILDQTTDAQGDFDRTSDGLANTGRVLKAAISDLQTALGVGLLSAFEDNISAGGDLAQTFVDLQPAARGAGNAVGQFFGEALNVLSDDALNTGENLEGVETRMNGVGISAQIAGGFMGELGNAFAGANSPLGTLFRLLGNANDETIALNKTNDLAAARYTALAAAIGSAAIAASQYRAAQFNASSATSGATAANITAVKQAERLGISVAELNRRIAAQSWELNNQARASRAAASGTNDLTAAQRQAIAAYDAQADRVTTAIDGLGNAVTALNNARQAFRDYAASIENAVLSAFNFGEALKPATNEAGQVSGASFVAGLVQQVTDARNFATVLTNLRNAGADQALIDQVVALGPAAGAALGSALINEGLVPTVNALTIEAQTIAKDVGFTMASEFLGAGVEAAVNFVNQAILTVGAEQRRLIKLGNNMGKLIGSGIKKEIAQAVAEAVRQAEAAKAAARAEAVAQAEARAQAITDQQVAQALSRLVINSDQRLGRNPSPVL